MRTSKLAPACHRASCRKAAAKLLSGLTPAKRILHPISYDAAHKKYTNKLIYIKNCKENRWVSSPI
jgi:hypothetical protein